jgi:hypothetical protein
MATKKKKKAGKKRRAKLSIGSDPPILIGGGGSSFIWIQKDLEPQLVNSVPNGAPQPETPDLYYCFRVQGNIGKVAVDDGNSGTGPGKSVNNKKYFVTFDS